MTGGHRVEVFSPSGQILRTYGSFTSFGNSDGQLTSPLGIAVSETEVFIGDCGRQDISVFDRLSCKFLRKLKGPISNIYGILLLTPEQLFVSDYPNNRLVVMNPTTGEVIKTIDGIQSPLGITANDTEIFVTELNAHRVCVLDHEGRVLRRFGSQGTGSGQFVNPHQCLLSAGGTELVVADYPNHRVQILSTDGTHIRTLGTGRAGSANGELSGPTGLAILNDRLYVVEYTVGRISSFT
jgi:YVTN family beta-propeller protein